MKREKKRKRIHRWLRDPQNRKEVQTLIGELLMGERPYSATVDLDGFKTRHAALTRALRAKFITEEYEVTDKGMRYFRGEI